MMRCGQGKGDLNRGHVKYDDWGRFNSNDDLNASLLVVVVFGGGVI